MNTNNPLRIFTPEQLGSLDLSDLKRIKKEILLEFQLTSESTIVLNGLEVDKNSILEIFDELNQKLPLYLFIHKNKNLNTFLNLGNISLFEDNKTIEIIKNLSEYKEDIEQKIVAKIKPLIASLIMKPTGANYELGSAKKFLENLNPGLIDEAYSEAYSDLKIHLDSLAEKYENPFTNQSGTNFKHGLGKHVNINFYYKLTYLPEIFNPLSRQYCRWCNDNIVYEALLKEKRLHKYSRESLSILRNAAKIASNATNKEGNLTIARSIQNYLEGNTNHATSSSGSGPSVWTILLVIFFFVRIVMLMGKCSNNSSNRYANNRENILYNQGRETTISAEQYNKILAEARRRNNTQSNNSSNSSTQSSSKNLSVNVKTSDMDFSGANSKIINAKLDRQKDYETLTELYYNIDVHPSKHTYFYKLIPDALAEKYKGQLRTVVFSFKHPDIKGSTLEHRLKYDFNTKKSYYPQDYNFKSSEYDEDLNLSIKRIPYSSYPLNGVLSRVDPTTGKVKHKTKFKIDYKKDTKEFTVTYKSSNRKITFPKSYITDLDAKYAIDEKDKFAIAIKNINLVNNKYLNEGNFYTMKDIFYYSIDPSTGTNYPSNNMLSEDAYLRYYITSEEDNTSYVELKSDNVNFKFYTDFETGITKGMSMVSTDLNKTEVERMILFSSK